MYQQTNMWESEASEDTIIDSEESPSAERRSNAYDNSLNSKSRQAYQAAYHTFMTWCGCRGVAEYTEEVLVSYFKSMATDAKLKSSCLWTRYSMLKRQLNVEHGIDIGRFGRLRAYLKERHKNYTPQKSRMLTREQVDRFLSLASDDKYLGVKVILIFAVSGALRCEELRKLTLRDINDLGPVLVVKIPSADETNNPRSFLIAEEEHVDLYRRYVRLRPRNMSQDGRFFIKFHNGMCQRVLMGVHKIGSVAREVATFLNLPDCKEYTWHAFKRTCKPCLVNRASVFSSARLGLDRAREEGKEGKERHEDPLFVAVEDVRKDVVESSNGVVASSNEVVSCVDPVASFESEGIKKEVVMDCSNDGDANDGTDVSGSSCGSNSTRLVDGVNASEDIGGFAERVFSFRNSTLTNCTFHVHLHKS